MRMRKLKKLLAGVVAAATVMSTMAMGAFAAQTTTPATIDDSLKGSLTIHKYEYNGTEGSKGTGSENDGIPEGAEPLAGAGFTLYKVADLEELKDYYSTNPKDLPSVQDYLKDGKIDPDKVKGTVKEIVTGTDGIAKFENLELGFYVVVETTTPDAVTDAMDPFIVSIPMTTVDGDNWLYDVHTYPKNGTSYGKIDLVKEGEDGAKLAGVTFVLQKDNGDGTWTTITKKAGAAGDNTGEALNLVTSTNGTISVADLTQGTYRFIETDRGDNKGYIMDGATAYVFTVNADGTVTYNGVTNAAITITVKNEKPDMTKEVQDRTDKTWGQDSDYNVGDVIPYKVTVDVPANITKLKEFKLTDTPTNLKDDATSVELTCDGAPVNEGAYEVTGNGNGFVITFVPAAMADYADKTIEITYNATLLEGAATTTDGNPNTAKLEYSNKILPETDDGSNPNKPGEPGKDAIEDTAVVYTFKLQVLKKAQSAEGTPLAGVKFDLYKEVAAGTEGALTGDAVKEAGLDTSKSWIKVASDLTTDAKGEVSHSGLANGTYYLVETKTNDGYNLLKAPVEVKLDIAYVTKTKTEYYIDEDGGKTLVKHEVETTVFTENGSSSTGIHTETIINKKGFELPTTGGMGTILFTAAGIVLIAGAAVLFFGTKRRKDA